MSKELPDWRSDVTALRPFAGVRLIIADLDGSLVRYSERSVPDSITSLRRALAASRARVLFTVATGRAWHGTHDLIEAIGIPRGTPIILYNGAVIVQHQSLGLLQRRQIDPEEASSLLSACTSVDLPAHCYIFQDPVSANFSGRPAEAVLAVGRQPTHDFNGLKIRNWGGTISELQNCAALLIENKTRRLPQEVQNAFARCVSVSATQSGDQFLEVRPLGITKGQALELVVSALGLRLSEVLAIGDNDNDVEMLESAGLGIAVHTASSAAIAASNYVCRYGPAAGAVEVLRLTKQAKRYFQDEHNSAARV